MSRLLLTKLDVDVLVQLAVLGPLEASDWDPVVEDADGFGRRLWSRNYEAAARPDGRPLPSYTFTPLPVAVTVVEGLKQLQFFLYQSVDQEGRWQRDELGELLAQLRERLIPMIGGYDGAPWGWAGVDLDALADRPAPRGAESEPAELPAVTALRERWDRAGLPLVIRKPDRGIVRLLGDSRRVLGSASHRPSGHMGFAPVLAILLADENAAVKVFTERVRELQTSVAAAGDDAHVYRYGDLVVTTRVLPSDDPATSDVIDRGIAHLGPADAHWWNGAPPLAEIAGEVIATGVRLTDHPGGTHLDKRAIFARTPAELAALLTMIDDPALRARLEEVSTRKQTVLLLRGIFHMDQVLSAEVYEDAGHRHVSDDIEHRLILTASNATSGMGSVVVLDRLSRIPHALQLESAGLRTAMIGDRPPRFGG